MSCRDCNFCSHETDGEYGEIDCGFTCTKPGQEHFSNLSSFPFKKDMPCFVQDFWLSPQSQNVEGFDATYEAAFAEWREEWKHQLGVST